LLACATSRAPEGSVHTCSLIAASTCRAVPALIKETTLSPNSSLLVTPIPIASKWLATTTPPVFTVYGRLAPGRNEVIMVYGGVRRGDRAHGGAAPAGGGVGLRHEPPWKVIVKPLQEAHWYTVWLPGSVSCLDHAYAFGQCALIASL